MSEATLDPGPSRRGFINWFLGTSAGAFLLSVLYPLSRYLVPPEVGESTAGTVTLADVKPDAVKPNTRADLQVRESARACWSGRRPASCAPSRPSAPT